jgi:hypothetical protein
LFILSVRHAGVALTRVTNAIFLVVVLDIMLGITSLCLQACHPWKINSSIQAVKEELVELCSSNREHLRPFMNCVESHDSASVEDSTHIIPCYVRSLFNKVLRGEQDRHSTIVHFYGNSLLIDWERPSLKH